LDGLREQQTQWAVELASLGEEDQRLGEEIQAAELEIQNSAREFDELVARINEKKVERSRLGERLNGIEYKLEKIRADISQFTLRRENLVIQQERDRDELQKIADSIEGVKVEKEERNQEKNATLVQISDTKAAFNETCTKLQDLREKRSELQKRREQVLGEIQELELKITQEQSGFEHLRGISLERYLQEPVPLDESAKIEIEKLPIFAAQLETQWGVLTEAEQQGLLQEHLKSLREKVTRYGEVNLTAIQEFDEIQKRYDFLMEQRTDLEKSISILEEAIKKIDESTKQRFHETFEAVDKKFREIFPILFSGGKAELTLTNAENVLDAGVDITVHPPGKRPASITLLSGGEKALTAVSLILAIFARKPSPFCLLDEVDAPLDDANVSRFNTVVKKMAEKTQFIVITHNKKTMEIAEALYGVTMEKPGISKMTSVRLN
jgi:chromosome segregation protein